ncbi:MAG: hypothetical protein KA140_00965 [Caldisericia bacterium]|nr:hypothetical protein [Caldisericia bacterium]
MFNYSLVENFKMIPILIYLVMWVCFVLGNWISVKLLNPEHKDWGRIFMGSLLLLCLHIFFSILCAWKEVLPFMYYSPIIGVIGMVVAWFFVSKYLYGHTWIKAIVAMIMPLLIAAAVFAIVYFAAPDFLKTYTAVRFM